MLTISNILKIGTDTDLPKHCHNNNKLILRVIRTPVDAEGSGSLSPSGEIRQVRDSVAYPSWKITVSTSLHRLSL